MLGCAGTAGSDVPLGRGRSLLFRPNIRLLELRFVLILISVLVLSACTEGSGPPRLDLETRDARQMALFYLGTYGAPAEAARALPAEGADFLYLDSLESFAPGLARMLAPAAEDGTVDQDEFLEAIASTYPWAAALPGTVQELRTLTGLGGEGWLTHEVSGSMTQFRRRLHIRRDAVRAALARRLLQGEGMTYDSGTWVVGEHLEDGRVVETTAMKRRGDGFWSFSAYDEAGAAVSSITGDPDPLVVPIDCFGCHYGNKPFEPERSFPAEARPGPHGPRAVFVDESLRRSGVVTLLQEHARRDDGLLGLYGTLYLSDLMNRSERGEPLDSLDARLVEAVPGS